MTSGYKENYNKKVVTKIDPLKDGRWDDYVLKHDEGILYHHSLWLKVIYKTYYFTPNCFIIEDKENKIYGGILLFLVNSIVTGKRLVSIPFSDHCGILTDDDVYIKILTDYVIEYAKKHFISTIELKLLKSKKWSNIDSFRLEENKYINHVLKINKSMDEIKKGYHKNYILRNLKKAKKNSLEIKIADKEEDIKIFYNLYVLTRKKHGLPPQPYIFFYNIWNIYKYYKKVIVYTIYTEKVPIASIILLIHKDTMYYLYSGSDSSYLEKRPNHLLLSYAIESANKIGLKYFDFGRTNNDNIGLITFKSAWGAYERKITSYLYSIKNKEKKLLNRNIKTKSLRHEIMKRVPTLLLKKIGKIIYPHLG